MSIPDPFSSRPNIKEEKAVWLARLAVQWNNRHTNQQAYRKFRKRATIPTLVPFLDIQFALLQMSP